MLHCLGICSPSSVASCGSRIAARCLPIAAASDALDLRRVFEQSGDGGLVCLHPFIDRLELLLLANMHEQTSAPIPPWFVIPTFHSARPDLAGFGVVVELLVGAAAPRFAAAPAASNYRPAPEQAAAARSFAPPSPRRWCRPPRETPRATRPPWQPCAIAHEVAFCHISFGSAVPPTLP